MVSRASCVVVVDQTGEGRLPARAGRGLVLVALVVERIGEDRLQAGGLVGGGVVARHGAVLRRRGAQVAGDTVAGLAQRPAVVMLPRSIPAAARSTAIPMRGEWPP